MDNSALNEILNVSPKIDEKRRYWFFRTQGGDYYEDFFTNGFIAIGYDKISLESIKSADTNNKVGIEILIEKIKKAYGDEVRSRYASSQLLKFATEMKKGDVVFIPNYSSNQITFGVISSAAFSADEISTNIDNPCPYRKTINVKWHKTVNKWQLDQHVFRLLYSRHAITEADEYGAFIDKYLNSFYIKGDNAHVIIHVQTQKDIKAKNLFGLGSLSLEIFEDFCKDEKIDIDTDSVNVKLNLQSPGYIEILGTAMTGIVLVGLIIVAVAGGGFNFSYEDEESKIKINTGIKSDGIIEKLRRYLSTDKSAKAKMKVLENHAKDLQIKDPDELVKVMKSLDDKK